MKKLMFLTAFIFLAFLVACGPVKLNPPQKPTELSATAISSSEINLAWNDNSTDELGFKIERKLHSSESWKEIAQTNANTTTYKDTNLDSDTTYDYRIRAYNNYGYSDYSNVASATTSAAIPQAPTNLAATALSSTQIKLTWQDNSTNELGFKIERKTGSSGSWIVVKQLGFNVTEYTDEGLTPETSYYYRVVAYNSAGNSPSDEVQVMTLLVAPANLTAKSISYYEVELNWEDNSNIETGYIVERQTSGTTEWKEIETLGENVTTYTDNTITKGQTYKYRVAAYRDEGKYYSNEISATVQQAWEMRYGKENVDDRAYCVAQTDDEGYLVAGITQTGPNNSDLYIMKIDSEGNKMWEKIYTASKEGTTLTNDEVPSAMQRTSDGNYIIAGYTKSFGPGDADFYVIKIDENGNKIWEKAYDWWQFRYNEEAYDIQQTSDEGYIVVGRGHSSTDTRVIIMKIDGNGNMLSEDAFHSRAHVPTDWNYAVTYSVKQTPDGGYLAAGEVREGGAYYQPDCMYVWKFASNGDLQVVNSWEKGFTDAPSSAAHSLDLTSDGGFVVAGQGLDTQGNKTVYVAKFNSYAFTDQQAADAGLQRVWSFTDGESQHTDVAWSIKQTTDGGYIVAGDRKYDTLNISDAMVYKLNANGGLEGGWTMQYGATDYNESGRAVLQTSDGGYIVVGYGDYFYNGVDYKDQFYVLKLDSKGYRGY